MSASQSLVSSPVSSSSAETEDEQSPGVQREDSELALAFKQHAEAHNDGKWELNVVFHGWEDEPDAAAESKEVKATEPATPASSSPSSAAADIADVAFVTMHAANVDDSPAASALTVAATKSASDPAKPAAVGWYARFLVFIGADSANNDVDLAFKSMTLPYKHAMRHWDAIVMIRTRASFVSVTAMLFYQGKCSG